jgi:ABC-type multidrug transport system ATPase subunit
VSSHHAVLVGDRAGLTIEDLGSHNGTFVRGHRIASGTRVAVSPGERVYIGPWPVVLGADGATPAAAPGPDKWAGQPLFEVEAWGLSLRVPDRDHPSTDKTILDEVSFKALPGDMIALMGPSGAGKTTLLMVLNGYLPPSDGQVRVNAEDLYAIYDNLRGVIGYVPQDDIVHPELTVFEAVRYSARFRLPPDTSDEEIDRRVEATLTELGLISLRNLEIGKPEKKVLSGGQRKRVNIAMELVTDPVILFLDEPTSGLAADDTTALIRSLSELTRRAGKTVIMTIHQPAKDEFELFNLVLLMGPGGIPLFFGPTSPEAYTFFGAFAQTLGQGPIANPRDIFDVLAQREKRVHQEMLARDPRTPRAAANALSATLWRREFYAPSNPVYVRMYGGERAVGQQPSTQAPRPTPPPTTGQLGLLVSRYLTVKRRDVVGTAIMLLQAPIIGGLLALVFHLAKRPEPAWCGPAAAGAAVESGANHAPAIFFLVVASVWFGTSNAAREVVSERAIYLRERMVNLKLGSYVASKYIVLSLFCVVQCTILLAIVSVVLGFHGGAETFFAELAILVATSMNAIALGLLLSTAVSTTEAAMALTPIALIPQVVLGGFVVPMSDSRPLAVLMSLMPARWGFQGVLTLDRGAIGECAKAAVTSDVLPLGSGLSEVPSAAPPAVLAGMTVIMLLTLVALLKRRDPI